MEDRFHSPSTPGSPDKPNANRRLTFITDPNSYAVTALMATASSSQVDVLRDFLYSYIAFKSDIGMFSESCGFSNSSLYFHLPFYSWRETHQEPRDLRLKEDGRPLRCVQDMSFLKAESQGTSFKKDYLCEAQVSVLIVTIDDTVWTGYCFVDTYYQPQGERKCVDDYYEDGMQTDPFTQGDANKPILSPTDYFLASLHYQLKVFRDEWMNTAYNFKKRVESYIKGFDYTLAESSVLTNRETQASLAWLFDTQDQLNMLIMSLETSIACWDNFTPQDHFPTIPITQPLKAIQQIFIEMRNCLIVLKNIRTLYDSHEKAV
ncbi:hypothetical protein KAF25_003484 [Fusarium avenaceum]|uniref:Uncharacterized protein n=1 Tax=Fusarium avenaceum TaxID=40199 RepID=A0A9P7H7S1_9HYPO|nr:hypothetical protein KAF25_003484 [Fusarium avenaceum]